MKNSNNKENPAVKIYGHKKIIQSLIHAMPPFLIFSGPSGVGKKHSALSLAQALLCEKTEEKPCNSCKACKQTAMRRHPSLLVIEPDGLSIKMEELSKIRSFLSLQSFSAHKIVVVDQAEQMNIHLQNALLKMLEEPSPNTHFIFITSQPYKLLSTVRSRARLVRFPPLSVEDLKQILPDEPEWALKISRGQLDRVHQWQDNEFLYREVFNFWHNILEGKRFSKEFSLQLKDRKNARLTARTWQEILRDVRFYQLGSKNWIHTHQPKLYEKLSRLPFKVIDDLYQKTLYLEQNIISYLDCVLCFEHFWVQSFNQIQARA